MSQTDWWKEVLELSHSAYLRISPDQYICDAVGDTQALLGYEPNELIGLTPEVLKDIRAQLGVAVSENLAKSEAQPGQTWGYEDSAGGYYCLSDGSVVIKLTASLQIDHGIVGRLVDQLPVMVAYIDREGCFRLNNQVYADFFGIRQEELYGQPVSSVLDAESYAKVSPRFQRALSGQEVNYEDQLSLQDGRTFYFKVKYVPDLVGHAVLGFYAIIQDVSEERAMINLLRDIHSGVNRTDISTSEIIDRLLHDALSTLSLDIGLVSRIIDDKYIIKWAASDAGIKPGDTFALGNTYCRLMLDTQDILHTIRAGQDDRISGHPCYQKLGLETYIGTPLHVDGEVWGTLNFSSATPRRRHFTDVEIELVRLVADAVERSIAYEHEVEQVRQERDMMAERAAHDHLTGLPNRSYLDQHVAALISRGEPFSIAVVDIDHFKQVNDTHGHDVGDTTIQWLGNRISECLRGNDILARVGGEEFVIVMPQTSLLAAEKVTERIRNYIKIGTIALLDDSELSITISVGVSEHVEGAPFADVLKRADTALYAAKHAGRDRVRTG
ncbi:diguanylate cyclase [Halomonas janggokensis]|uniref:diguanylate cyclase n=1 Tax=Vreelandella janggokensis TaxID=370767 RepID=A0ABT4IQB7_9GAMM|nr:diguanylate cyclase [Halomonas janggokensis]MCZ0925866.1 diguanylate cyclase [Halomonas janggokensis]MCZ0930933.1 diguanylate cyclase [Halomonas janggokensis]